MYSKETQNLGLPQWEPKDHPDFLTDINTAFKKVDDFAGDMDFISEPMFNEVVRKQNQLSADMQKLQDDFKILDSEEHDLEGRVTSAEDRIQHEHETNDTQNTQIKNLQSDLHNEVKRAETTEEIIQEKLDSEINRATTTELLIQENVNAEVQRAVASEKLINQKLEELSSSTDELTETVQTQQENEEQQDIMIGNLAQSFIVRKTEVDNKLTTLQSEHDTLSARIDTNSQKITDLEPLTDKVTGLESSMSSAEIRISALEDGLSGGGEEELTMGDVTNAIDTKLVPVNNSISTINTNVSTLTSRTTTAETEITSLKTRMSGAETNISNLETANTQFLKKTDAANIYLTQTNATNTYLSKSDASSTYLSKSDASSTYLTKTSANDTLLTKTSASNTYVTNTDFNEYATTTTANITDHSNRLTILEADTKMIPCTIRIVGLRDFNFTTQSDTLISGIPYTLKLTLDLQINSKNFDKLPTGTGLFNVLIPGGNHYAMVGNMFCEYTVSDAIIPWDGNNLTIATLTNQTFQFTQNSGSAINKPSSSVLEGFIMAVPGYVERAESN